MTEAEVGQAPRPRRHERIVQWAVRRVRSVPVRAAAIWVAVWALTAVSGQPVQRFLLESDTQMLPLDSLVGDPWRSVWYLHIQPPLWNLLIGLGGGTVGLTLTTVLLLGGSGAVLAGAIATTLQRLGVTRRWVLALTAVATCNGYVLGFAFVPRYDLPSAALVALLVAGASAASPRRAVWGAASVVTTLGATRAMFHPAWCLAVVALVAVWHGGGVRVVVRRAAPAMLLPTLVLGGWMVKNEVLFDRATTSSLAGMNLLRSVQPAVDPRVIAADRARGAISEVGALATFADLATYRAAGAAADCPSPADHPVLTDAQRRPSAALLPGTVTNFNHACFLPIYDAAAGDARRLIADHPDAWLRARVWSLNNAATVPPAVAADSPVLMALRVPTALLYATVPHPGVPEHWEYGAWWVQPLPLSPVALGAPALVAVVGLGAWRRRRRRARASPDGAVTAIAAPVVAWVSILGLFGELGEQARFRLVLDPICLALAGAVSVRVVPVVARRCLSQVRRVLPAPLVSGRSLARRSTTTAAAVLVAVVGVVLVGDGATGFVAPPVARTPSATTLPASRPVCDRLVHVGDSNLAISAGLFRDAYAVAGIDADVDGAVSRGAVVADEGVRPAVTVIDDERRSDLGTRTCWVLALSARDAADAAELGRDADASIEALLDAVGDDPTLWITPVMVNASGRWSHAAAATYVERLIALTSGTPSVTVLRWDDVAFAHLDEFQDDGVHYHESLYRRQVDWLTAAITRLWDVR